MRYAAVRYNGKTFQRRLSSEKETAVKFEIAVLKREG
jgi:hypothetical protein